MDWVVLGKVVPDADRVGYDEERRTLRRTGVELFLNPFDQRAVRIALDLRAPGERVTLVSMGPPEAAAALREPLALGVDRAILITDPALAGSDTLATARVLAAAVRQLNAPLLLTGRWSTDAETGQLPAQVAALLARPFRPAARRIERVDAARLRVVSDTESGWEQVTVALPAVVAVGEKIAALRKASEAQKSEVPMESVERWDLGALGLAPRDVGPLGSPTSVASVTLIAPRRTPILFEEGTESERVARFLGWLTGREPVRGPAAASAAGDRGRPIRLLVSASTGGMDPGAPALAADLAKSGFGGTLELVWVGRPPTTEERGALGSVGPVSILRIPAEGIVDERRAATAIGATLGDPPVPDGIVFPSTEFGRAVGGRLAATLGLGLTGDAIAIRVDPSGGLTGIKPAFGGRYDAEIRHSVAPALFTLRPSGGPRPAPGAPAPVRDRPVDLPPSSYLLESTGTEVDATSTRLEEAALLVAAGLGVGGPEGVQELGALAERWGAALGASRKVVDAGWLPRQRQIGLTGRSLAPRLALLVASSGRPNQTIGYRRAGTVVLLSQDREAAAAAEVDAAIIGDWRALTGELDRQGAERLRAFATVAR